MKLILILSAMFFTFNCFSATKLIPGSQVLVDVANTEYVSLVINTSLEDSSILPEVSIQKQWSGFECSHKGTLLRRAAYDLRSWEIQIQWLPGADLSGCIVKVTFPGLQDSFAELFMNY